MRKAVYHCLGHKMVVVIMFVLFASTSTFAQDLQPLAAPLTTAAESHSNLKQGLVLGGAALAASFAYDKQISQSLQSAVPAGSSWVPDTITSLGGGEGVIALHSLIYAHDKELAWRSAKATATAVAATYVLKIALGRERPFMPGSTGEFHGFSFADGLNSMPSGHTTAVFAMARVLADHDPKHAALYYTGAALVGASRINLAMHWPSDVVAGALIGLAVGGAF